LSSKPHTLTKAVDAFGELPADVASLGKPLSVHPPLGAAQAVVRMAAKIGVAAENSVAKRRLAAALTIGLPLIGAGCLIPYLNGARFGKAPPEFWLIIPVSGVVFGLISGIWWWRLSRAADDLPDQPPEDPTSPLPGVILYPDALVHVRKKEFTVIRWEDVRTLDAPASKSRWRVTASDGRQIELPGWIEDDGTAIESTIERVTAVLLPKFLERIEAGKKVSFGPFGVSKRAVYFKGKKADWDDVTRMRILTGRVYCLQIYCGWFLPWCTFSLLTAPNGQLVYELIRRVAPARLLKPV
jgi:hypothetical protein